MLSDTTHMVDKECKVEKAPGAMLEILLSYSESRRTELRPVKVLLSMQLIWLLRSILEERDPFIYLPHLNALKHVYDPILKPVPSASTKNFPEV